jgi:hypothetical protein
MGLKLPATIALCWVLITGSLQAQSYGLSDGRNTHSLCQECEARIAAQPREVLFGIHILDNEIYFSMTSTEWFNKLFTADSDGLTVDIVSKDQFECDQPAINPVRLPRGTFLPPVLLPELKKRIEPRPDGGVNIRLGSVPPALRGKEIEGNLVIVRNKMICSYNAFTNLDRSLWGLLDMGLYADSLINLDEALLRSEDGPQYLLYTKKIVVNVPFLKGKSTYSPADIKPLYDSLHLEGFSIKKIGIRAFSSVDGAYETNQRLQAQRAESIIKAIESYQKKKFLTEVQTSENWLEFMRDIARSPHAYLGAMDQEAIRGRLKPNEKLTDSLEQILSRHRKAVVTIYLDYKNPADDISKQEIITRFKEAIAGKDTKKAAAIQRSVFERIRDNQLPENYLDLLEIPLEKDFISILQNREAYKYLLSQAGETEAIENLKQLEKLDPSNGKIKYNLYALQLRLWQYDPETLDRDQFISLIKKLPAYGIPDNLVRRMVINYNIIACEFYMKTGNYAMKDKALLEIKQHYLDKSFTDADLLSLAKYFCYYSALVWADEMIAPRMDKLDVNEDLLFFYINLSFFTGKDFQSAAFNDMLLNATGIDNQRFCRLFNAIDLGGISMQVLLDPFWKKKYCDHCQGIKIKRGT